MDGQSKDKTVINAQKFPVKILYEHYHSRAGACKIGVENASGEFIAFTDADCLPQNDWLENLLKEFDSKTIGVGGCIKNIGKGLWERSINLVMGTFLGSANSIQGRFFEDKRYVKSISGCNCMYRKEDILKIGSFDVALHTAEDTNLNSKLLKLGKLLYTPNAIIMHNHQRGLRSFAKRMYQYGYGRARARLLDLQVIPPLLALLLIILLFYNYYIFLAVMGIYLLGSLYIGIRFAKTEKNPRYMFSIPMVYFVEHSMYILGFWHGIFIYLCSQFNYLTAR